MVRWIERSRSFISVLRNFRGPRGPLMAFALRKSGKERSFRWHEISEAWTSMLLKIWKTRLVPQTNHFYAVHFTAFPHVRVLLNSLSVSLWTLVKLVKLSLNQLNSQFKVLRSSQKCTENESAYINEAAVRAEKMPKHTNRKCRLPTKRSQKCIASGRMQARKNSRIFHSNISSRFSTQNRIA